MFIFMACGCVALYIIIGCFRFGTGDHEDGKPSENIDLRMRETELVSVLLSFGTVLG